MVQEEEKIASRAVLVFARRPELGRVKTRLEARIGQQLALSLYRAFLTDTLSAARQSGATTVLAHTLGPPFPEQLLADISFAQRGNSFAERFDAALEDATNRLPKETPLVIVGTDAPHLSPKSLRKTFDLLKEHGAVIGPNVNGGFYLLGFSSHPVPVSGVFSLPSFEETQELIRLLQSARLTYKFLDPQFDVDVPEDLMKLITLINELEDSGADWIPENTRNVLRDMGIVSLILQTEHQNNPKV